MKAPLSLALLVCVAVAVTGCPKKQAIIGPEPRVETDYDAPLPSGRLALRRITDPRQIPDLTPACLKTEGLRQAIQYSLDYLAKPSSQARFPYGEITRDQAIVSLQAMLVLVNSGLSPSQMDEAIRQQFDVYISVGCDDKGTVLFTGYYTPIFQASASRTEKFKYPLYKAPPGLEKLPDGNPSKPLSDRKTIETSNMFAGNELVWLADPFEAYVANVQGSAKLRMTDGTELTVGYAANNGHEYNSIRAEMVTDGKIGKRDGLQAMIRYFRTHPEEVTLYTWRNPRFVFFAPIADGMPRGCLNEPVTVLRTIATDKKIFPAACLAFVNTKLPMRQDGAVADTDYSGFALDQDAGGAIRAAGRCDVYMGVGDEAGELAGRTQNEGKLYYLFLKPGALAAKAASAAGPPAVPGKAPGAAPAPAPGPR